MIDRKHEIPHDGAIYDLIWSDPDIFLGGGFHRGKRGICLDETWWRRLILGTSWIL